MNQYVGLDVSLEETKIHVLDEAGGRVWRGKCASHPDELETAICKHAPGAVRIGLETGPLTTWLWTELSERRLPMVCLDARAGLCHISGFYLLLLSSRREPGYAIPMP